MALLLNAQGLSKTFGAVPLFRNVSLNVFEGGRLGLVGPNGSGKSTLLQILAGRIEPDTGEVAARKNTHLAYIAQESQYTGSDTIRTVIRRALEKAGIPDSERDGREAETLGRTGFTDFDAVAATLSGGWRKRLAIAESLVLKPEILLLDEPTNHLDIAGISWLEKLLQNAAFSSVVISHDRYFLENVATEMAELNRVYPDGLMRVDGNYSTFLEKKSEFLAAQAKHQDALENRVRTEIEWLRRGPKARATKAKARIDNAHGLIGELKDLSARSRTSSADIDFTATERKTKRLIELENVSYGFDERVLFKDLNFTLTGGTRLGLVGPNGSGKTTLLRLLRGEVEPLSGEIRRAQTLRIVYFDQNRPLDPSLTLRRALAPDSDSVVFQGRTLHVASWADRFLFANEQLNQPVSRLSGGERARVSIARLMLEPADVLLLDEPTNDLDIPTLEILEESLVEFTGALVLVTHDRYMLDRVSTLVLGLDGNGTVQGFADYSQWESWQTEQKQQKDAAAREQRGLASGVRSPAKKKLSYLDKRDMETIEARVSEADEALTAKRALLDDSAVITDPVRLREAYREIKEAQEAVDKLYARWSELEAKIL
ncbi:MAG: ABC-F family ATP-binding cassette domain-containing protein [Acidobacteriota bacterium]|nr:ABC-F family ATP-binding cassette domain-containing protein [Acidobacteriota bacterium]